MFNWFDLMGQAQGGAALDNMARQFGLSPEQAQLATAALLPAFAMGLQHAATQPHAMDRVFKLMSTGHYPNFFESAAQAFSPQARQEGSTILNQIFGSDEVSRRVAQQAAAFSGVGVDILQQMLPLMAGIFAGGLAKLAQSGAPAFSAGPKAAAAAPAADPARQSQAGLEAWIDLWNGLMGARPAKKEPEKEPEKAPPAPDTFDDMMTHYLAGHRPPSPSPEPEEPEPQDAVEAWGRMMEAGREMQQQHLASLQSILDSVWDRGPAKDGGKPAKDSGKPAKDGSKPARDGGKPA